MVKISFAALVVFRRAFLSRGVRGHFARNIEIDRVYTADILIFALLQCVQLFVQTSRIFTGVFSSTYTRNDHYHLYNSSRAYISPRLAGGRWGGHVVRTAIAATRGIHKGERPCDFSRYGTNSPQFVANPNSAHWELRNGRFLCLSVQPLTTTW